MKKIIIMLLSLCMLFSIVGCTAPAEDTQTTTTNSTEANTSTAETTEATTNSSEDIIVEQMPMAAISVPVVTQTEKARDGTVIFNYTFQNISMIVPDPEIADKVIVDFLTKIDNTAATAEIIRTAAQSGYTSGTGWSPYLCQMTYDPMRIDQGILSMFGSYATYSGTPHPEASYISASYDLVTGKVLDLSDILTEDANADTLYRSVVDALTAQQNDRSLYKGFESIVHERFNKDFINDDGWYFSSEGLCFYFSPYEIAPYSSGVIVAEVPYSQLAGILNDAYFPAEREPGYGSVTAELFDESDSDRFTQFAEVVLEEGSDKILLYTDKSAYDIRIETGSWSSDGETFIPEHTVLAAYSLTPGDAIMIDAPLEETLPTLRLSYNSGETTHYFYITGNSQAGTVTLTES